MFALTEDSSVYILDLGLICGNLARLKTLSLSLDWEFLKGRNSKMGSEVSLTGLLRGKWK